jgi:VanZ family protein
LRILSWLLFGVYLAAIVVASLAPPSRVSVMGQHDKWFHLTAYVGLALVAWPALRSPTSFRRGLIALAFFGIALEGLQSLVPGRQPSLLDGAANVAGLLLGGATMLGIVRFREDTCRRS